MSKLKFLLVFILLLVNNSLQAYSSNPQEFINELVKDAISKLSDKNLNDDQKSKFIENLALENVDINALGLFTLGELRKSSDKDIILKYQQSFEKYFYTLYLIKVS